MMLRPLFPALNAPEICWVCRGGGCACGADGGASPLQTSPKVILLCAFRLCPSRPPESCTAVHFSDLSLQTSPVSCTAVCFQASPLQTSPKVVLLCTFRICPSRPPRKLYCCVLQDLSFQTSPESYTAVDLSFQTSLEN
jgi:hypothetical protein